MQQLKEIERTKMSSNIVIIACSIFKFELELLKKAGKINEPIVYLNSMLHMDQAKLKKTLDKTIDNYKSYKIILIYGDCHAEIYDYEENANILRTPGINCCEIFLGEKEYKKQRKEGAFLLLPEWIKRWKEVFIDHLGFKDSKAIKPFMNEMHKKLVYIDAGTYCTDKKLLNEISDFVGLPLEIHKTTIDELERVILNLINKHAGR